jgi:hypothetical protein
LAVIKDVINVEALLAVFLVSGVAILSVALGVFSAYCAISSLLAMFNPSRNHKPLPALVPSQASGD